MFAFSAFDVTGHPRDQGVCEKLFRYTGSVRSLNRRELLERCAEDVMLGAEKELADTKAPIEALKRQARLATTTGEQRSIQIELEELERAQRRQRERIFDMEDEIAGQRDKLIDDLVTRLQQKTHREPLFTIRWTVQ